jgi:hypothetical protein
MWQNSHLDVAFTPKYSKILIKTILRNLFVTYTLADEKIEIE